MATAQLPGTATFLTLDTPAQTTPGAAIAFVGTYQGNPQALDYNFGSGWIAAPAPTFSGGTFTFTVPGNLPAGSYTPEVRDHNAPWIDATAGRFVVDPWSPSALTMSPGAVAVFEFNAGNPYIVAAAAGGIVRRVENALYPVQALTAVVATGGNPVVIANGSGADGKRRLLQFQPSYVNPNIYDPSTNWLDAGGVNGSAGAALVDLANSTNLAANGSFTTVIAIDINRAYSYAAGPIWGSPQSPGPVQWAQLRYNGGSGETGAQVIDANGHAALAENGTVTSGWHVMTMIKSNGIITYRLDGQQVATAAVTSTLPFTASDFMIGGGFGVGVSAGLENGVPPPFIGEFQAYRGVLAGVDLADAEKLAGNSIGLSLQPTVYTPIAVADAVTKAAVPALGTPYTGSIPGPRSEFVNITRESLAILANTPNWFIYGGAGNDAVGASSGTNVLDGGGGSNYLKGGTGTDSFYLDDRALGPGGIWSTLAGFHAGDSATVWGISAAGFNLSWADGQGTGPATGLTLHATNAAGFTASVTLAGWSSGDLATGRLNVSFGAVPGSGMVFTSFHANG